MHEIELKFQVPAVQRAAIDAAIAGRAPRPRMRLQAAYFDTPERVLAQAGFALRLRREGRQWVQTLKGGSTDGMTRLEHNVPRGAGAALPPIAPALHAGTPAGDSLRALLKDGSLDALGVLYRTDILRRTRLLRSAGGRVELALDLGRIQAAGASLPVLELEIELHAGAPIAVLATARQWVARHGLWLDTRSKAERGDLLARGEAVAPPRPALPVLLAEGMSAPAAWQAVLRSCLDQIVVNASQIAAGEHAPEHVHQLRVGLRRLRSALALFEGLGGDAALGEGARALFRRLGGARDAVVIEGEFAADLRAAMRSAGVPDDGPAASPAGHAATPTEVLRETGSQMLLLDLLTAAQTDGDAPDAAADPRAHLAQRLSHWHRQVVTGAKRFADLDDVGRHALRKRSKRLRYAIEFCGTLFDEARGMRRYLRVLRGVQERLGALADVLMAMQAFADRRATDPRALFALGWLAARREMLIAAAAPELKALVKAKPFWKRD